MMRKIKIMTDSACDIPVELEKELDIKILSFPITVDNVSYMERVDFDAHRFYDILRTANSLPITSQITPFRFCEEFAMQYKQGFNDLIYVSINSKGSNTNSAAHMAKDMFYNEHPDAKDNFFIHIVDSITYTIAYGYPVIEAAKKAHSGSSVNEILAYLDDWFNSVEIYFAPYTLEYVKKSGRVGCTAAFVGELLGLRPIISIIDGETKIVEKVRGDKSIIPAIIKHAKLHRLPKTEYCLAQSTLPTEYENLLNKSIKEFGAKPAQSFQVGACIAINAGYKVSGIIIKGKNRKINP